MKALALCAMPRPMPASPGNTSPTGASGLTVDCWPGTKPFSRSSASVNGIDALVAKPVVQREPRLDAPLVLHVGGDAPDADLAGEIAETLIERHRRAQQQVRDGVVGRKRPGEHEERVGRDRLDHVDAGAPHLAADLHHVRPARPRQAVLDLERVLLRVARPGDGAADRRVAADVEERRSLSDLVGRDVAETERARRRPVQALVEEEDVPQERRAERVRQRTARRCACWTASPRASRGRRASESPARRSRGPRSD